MAMSEGTDVSAGNTAPSLGNFLGGLGNLVLDSARARFVDVETKNDGNHVPDRADQIAGVDQQASRDQLGGVFKRKLLGVELTTWAIVGVGLVASSVVLKKTKVI